LRLAAFIVLNEVRYDPPGPDTGGEYIELFNPTDEPVALDGSWTLERGNGARANDWVVVWTGDGTVVEPGGFLVVGDDPRANRSATLSLQNGPDACRVRGPGGFTDLLGWGLHDLDEYAEGEPAADPPIGLLARRPDGRDTNDNAIDWIPAARETPGRLNAPPRSLTATLAFPPTDPSVLVPGDSFVVRVRLEATGLLDIARGSAGVRLDPSGVVWALEEQLVPGAVVDIEIPHAPLEVGAQSLGVTVWGTDDVVERSSASVLCGLGPVVLSEIEASPAGEAPEWIELERVERSSWESGEWSIVDGGRESVPFSLHAAPADARWVVLTRDANTFLVAFPGVAPGMVFGVPLPALNDRDEALYLVSPGGTIVDGVSFDAPPHGSLERVNAALPSIDPAAWVACPRGSTPGAKNAAFARPKPDHGLEVIPRVVSGEGCEIRVNLGDGPGTLDLSIVDLEGTLIGSVLSRARASARTGLHWDGNIEGEALRPGLYLLVARYATTDGVRLLRTSFAVGRRR